MASIFKRGPDKKNRYAPYWICYTDFDGKRRMVKGCTDYEATKRIAAKLENEVAERKHGTLDPAKERMLQQAQQPLIEHLDDFEKYLLGKGNTDKHADITRTHVEAILTGCKIERLADLAPSAVVAWLADERQAGRIGIKTSNYYLRDMKAFCNWLVKDHRAPANPLAHLSPMNANVDDRRERRCLDPDEFAAFITAAHKGKANHRHSGPDRAMLYIITANVGFRASEMASLTPESFDLDSKPPTVTVEASYSKHRRKDTQPLRPDLAELIRNWLLGRPPKDLLWPGSWWNTAAEMLRFDLDAAKAAWIKEAGEDEAERKRRIESTYLSYTDDAGRVFDFHALRHQFISNLASAGVHPKVAQLLARHSTITLTMDCYTHLGLHDQTAALDKLPPLPSVKPPVAELKATGTDDTTTPSSSLQRRCSTPGSPRGRGTSFAVVNDDSGDDLRKSKKLKEEKELSANQPGLALKVPSSQEEAPPGFEPGMADLQSAALPLG